MDDIAHLTYSGPRFSFVVLSRPHIRHAIIPEPHVVISIGDSGDEDVKIAASPLCRAILRLQFDDVDQETKRLRGRVAMTDRNAQAILEFVAEHVRVGEVKTAVCQCGMGISRSAGVAAALSQILQGEDAFFFSTFLPNRHVY